MDKWCILSLYQRLLTQETHHSTAYATFHEFGHVPTDEVPEQISENLLAFLVSVYSR